MYRLKFAKTYDNSIFYKYNIKPVVEDYLNVNDEAFCVADGITRDLTDGTVTPYPETLEQVNMIKEKYPNPSGAYEAAKITCDKFIEYISNIDIKEINEEILLNIIKKVNSDIWEINKDRDINYLTEDLYACEAAGGIIVDNNLYCFSIGDCHITLLDENLERVFDTPSNDNFLNYTNPLFEELGFDWENRECKYLIRRFFRNNPLLKDNGKDITYGALSGEKTAEYYINIFKVDLTNVKYICCYSDGYEPNFENGEEIKKLINNPEDSKATGKEKTLVLYKLDN